MDQWIIPEEGISGFINPAVMTVAAMFVSSAGLQKTDGVVFHPGGYRYADFMRIGLPLNLIFRGLAGVSG